MLNVAVVGNVDGGKSSIVGVLSSNALDDGNGDARSKIIKHPHEKFSGRTSDVNYVRFSANIFFIDLCGHEGYLRTTLRGLTTYAPNYALVAVALNKGISPVTCNHIGICRVLRIPFFLVFTKQDMAPPDVAKETMQNLVKFCKSDKVNVKFMYEIKDETSMLNALTRYENSLSTVCPYIIVSNKTGLGIPLLKEFILRLPIMKMPAVIAATMPVVMDTGSNYTNMCNFAAAQKITHIFHIYKPLYSPGIGFVLHGKQLIGSLRKGDITRIGPVQGHYHDIKIRSIHNESREEITELTPGLSGCLAFRSVGDSSFVANRRNLTNGKVCLNTPILVVQIRADVLIINPDTIAIVKGYQPSCTLILSRYQVSLCIVIHFLFDIRIVPR